MEIFNKIKVRVFDNSGITEYNDIRLIRIVSKDYSMLIMDEHTSAIGEIDGIITINSNEIDKEFRHIKGYYVHDDSVFNLFIKEY